MTKHDIARITHEANRALQTVAGEKPSPPWEIAEGWMVESSLSGVEFRLEHPNAPISHQHTSWMADKVADGWTYGPVKDAQAKTHPCLVPFDQLPPLQQAKDKLFVAIVEALSHLVTE